MTSDHYWLQRDGATVHTTIEGRAMEATIGLSCRFLEAEKLKVNNVDTFFF